MRGFIIAVLLLVGSGTHGRADETLAADAKKEIVQELTRLLDEVYVMHSTAEVLGSELRTRLDTGAYDAMSRAEFVEAVNALLWDRARDKHLKVREATGEDAPAAGGPRIVRRAPGSPDSPEGPGGTGAPPAMPNMEPFPRAGMLDAYVGLVEVRLFPPLARSEEAAAKAMASVAGARVILFDLRGCVGGEPDMVHFLTSYLYPPEPFHLLTYYHAHEPPDSAYTLEEVPGERNSGASVYVLTSSLTASGGEEFTYNLKHHDRAIVVGERTAGAGHGGGVHHLGHGLQVFMPNFRPVHPRTNEGWEGVGVEPDVEVPAERAEAIAHKIALEKLLSSVFVSKFQAVGMREQLALVDERIARFDAPLDMEKLGEYAGTYDVRSIVLDSDGLSIQRRGGPVLRLAPTDDPDVFTLRAIPTALVEFGRDDAGDVVEVRVLNPQGRWERSKRTG